MAPKLLTVSVVEAMTEDLRRRVLAGEIAPGAALGEVELAREYEVARPSAKAAIETLVHERLLVRGAHRSARVVQLTGADAADIYRTRAFLESEVIRHLAAHREVPEAARRANEEIANLLDASPRAIIEPDLRFHRSLVDAVGSERTSRIYSSIASEVVLCMSQVQGAALLATAAIAEEHARILELIEAGDADGASALLQAHVGRASERLAERLDAGSRAGV